MKSIPTPVIWDATFIYTEFPYVVGPLFMGLLFYWPVSQVLVPLCFNHRGSVLYVLSWWNIKCLIKLAVQGLYRKPLGDWLTSFLATVTLLFLFKAFSCFTWPHIGDETISAVAVATTVSMVPTQMGQLSYFIAVILNQTRARLWKWWMPRSPWQPERIFQLSVHLCAGWFLPGERNLPGKKTSLTNSYFCGPAVSFRSRWGRPPRCPPRWVPICSSCPAFTCGCQKCSKNERGHREKSRPVTATEIAPEDSCVWATVINVMLIPTKMMGERPCKNIYNQ